MNCFAGYGSQALALEYLGKDFEPYKVIEFDKYAIQTYNEIHNTNFKTQDILNTKGSDLEIVETDKYDYLLTYSFPCIDLSLAGKRAGMGKGTRSGLLWEVERILTELKELPQILLMENVPQVIGTENIKNFHKWREFLEKLGYKNYVENLNAKNYEIPQTRNRTFMVSILGDYNYTFPKPVKLKYKLKDFLEPNVDESYYLSDKKIKQITNWKSYQNPLKDIDKEKELVPTITARGGEEHSGMILINKDVYKNTENYIEWEDKTSISMMNRAWKDDKIIDTIHTNSSQMCLLINEDSKKGYAVAENGDGVYIDRPHQKRGVVQKDMIPTIKTQSNGVGVVVNDTNSNKKRLRIRKITPRECFRLMGVRDEDIDKITCSNAQKYKLAGNSIVVNVLMAIFKHFY